MRRLDVLRNILKKAKTNDIYMLDVNVLAKPGDIDVRALPIEDWEGNVTGVIIEHHYPSQDTDADWAAPIWTYHEVFKITPPKRFR